MSLVPMLNLSPANEDTRTSPSNIEAEQALLGIVMFDNGRFQAVSHLTPECFFEPFHARMWVAIGEMIGLGQLAEPIAVMERFKRDPAFEDLGGLRYLADLIDRSPPAANAPDYARIIQGVSLRRDLIRFGATVTSGAAETDDPYDVLNQAEALLDRLAKGAAPDETCLIDARASAEATLAEIENEAESGIPKGYMTGLRCIDRRLRGLKPGHLIIIAGRPSMGKTALARQACMGAAGRNPHQLFAFFALEMHRRELDERTLSELTHVEGEGIAYQDMTGDKLIHSERKRLKDLIWKIPRNFMIDDTASLTVDYVKRRVWALKRRGPVGAVFIDYLQIMDRPQSNGRNDASVIGEMTKGLKNLARSANICIVLLSQINRGVEQRDDKRPQLSDLRESGSIEQDANAVLFPFREVYYVERAEPRPASTEHAAWEQSVEELRRRMDVICAKNRGGATGSDHQAYFAEFDRVEDVREERR